MKAKVYYTMVEVGTAKIIKESSSQVDRFGNDLYPTDWVLWANKVMVWFRGYIRNIRRAMSMYKLTWNSAVSSCWSAIRSGLKSISKFFCNNH